VSVFSKACFLFYIAGKAPHRYAVQGSDTTMMNRDKMLVKKIKNINFPLSLNLAMPLNFQ